MKKTIIFLVTFCIAITACLINTAPASADPGKLHPSPYSIEDEM